MVFEWNTRPLGELLELVIDHRGKTPNKMGFEDFHTHGYPVLSAKHVKTDKLVNVDAMRFANEDMYKKWMKVEIQEGDIALTSEAPMGKVFYLDGKVKYVLGQRVFGLRAKKELIDPLYLTAWLASMRGQTQLEARASGSTVLGIKQSELLKIDVDVPPREVQVEIAKIRYDLSKKIELNRQTNQTLEHIAQAIFKSWFVDFDPTRAKIAAKKHWLALNQTIECSSPTCYAEQFEKPTQDNTSLEDAMTTAAMCAISGKTEEQLKELSEETLQQLKTTADLFPDVLVDFELGEVPEGWALGELRAIAEFSTDRIDVSKLTLENYISTENMLEGKKGVSIASSLPTVKTVPRFSSSQILISNIRPYFMKIWLARFGGGRSNDVLGIEAKESESVEYLYNLLYQNVFFNFMMTTSKGAKMPRGDKEAIMGWSCVQPDMKAKKAYSGAVASLYEIIHCNNNENESLAKTRDALLPKLLSGELHLNKMGEK